MKGKIREKKLLMETTKNKREEEEFKGLNVGLEAGYKETHMLSRGVREGGVRGLKFSQSVNRDCVGRSK